MGIAPYKYFTYDGESSRDYDVYLTGEGVFNAPERAVEMLEIPGRNGNYALDQGKFNNITVTYKAGIVDVSESDFADKVSAVRNWLCSKVGYKRLSDDYNPNEYRMAVYKSGVNIEHEDLRTGEFEITFDCKPQRWLTSGEEAVTIGEWGETTTVSGDVVEIEATATDAVKSLVADIDPIQDLNGYDAPWVGGAGKNLLKVTATTTTVNGVKYTVNADGTVKAENTATSNAFFTVGSVTLTANTSYILNGCPSGGGSNKYLIYFQGQSNGDTGSGLTYTPTADETLNVRLAVYSGQTANYTFKPMVRLATVSDATFAQYENICPISGSTEVNITVTDDLVSPTQTEVTTAPLGTTVYGGTLDVVSGELTVTHKYISAQATFASSYNTDSTHANALFGFNVNDSQISVNNNAKYGIVSNLFEEVTFNQALSASNEYYGTYLNNSTGQTIVRVAIPKSLGILTVADFNTWLTSKGGIQIAYPLATPQTYQLTPQQVELLLGTANYVWANSGDVTLEYGHNPMVLANPTQFDSEPLLAITGYGEIGFNGYTIDVGSVAIGDVILSSGVADSFLSRTISINGATLMTGDTITINGIKNTEGHSVKAGATITNTNFGVLVNCVGNVSDNNRTLQMVADPMTFTYGTASTSTASLSFGVSYTDGGSHYYSSPCAMTVEYDGADTFTIKTPVIIGANGPYSSYSRAVTVSQITAYSTKLATNNIAYIDCEIGECWMESGGAIVSLNNVVTLGSDLPMLASGTNTFTYDNTVTDLKVTPRWWKV